MSAPGRPSRSWKLAAPHDGWAQGLVVSGFASLPTGRALFLEFDWRGVEQTGGGAWLRALSRAAPITDADGKEARSAAISFTFNGLRKMGLQANTLASFDRPFQEGMFQVDRLRRLGDRRDGEWQGTVIPGGPRWSGNQPLDDAAFDEEVRAFDMLETHAGEERVQTEVTVHALLLLYEQDAARADAWSEEVRALLAEHAVSVVHQLPLELKQDANGVAREHFGFADGISQPIPFGTAVVDKEGHAFPRDAWNGVPLGEVLMGHQNAHNEIAPGPVVPDTPGARSCGLQSHPKGEGFLDFGLDGTYLVVRELKQDVVAFWDAMRRGAEQIRLADPDAAYATTSWLAERVVGRDTKGNLLCPGGVLPTDASGRPENDFGFFDTDPHGIGCPVGSHVRRANPRDALAPKAADKQTLLDAANSHRILRRGRKYGGPVTMPPQEDGVDRGLLFIALNTDIGRQFEFIQQTWILNPNFGTLYDETDPLVGPAGSMTIGEDGLRRIVPVETFVQMAGGEYFFLPSIPALRYLEAL